VTVTWNLRRGPVAPSVRIYGPECGCMTNDDTEKSLHFIAGATPAGGEFSEFVVTSNGKMPEIISNNGGDQPSLDLVGTKDTGEVTLKITYTQNGVRRTSDPFVVNFCAIEKLELADDEHDLAFDGLGRLVVNAKAKAWRAGNDVSAELEWDLEKMGAPTELRAEPANRTGKEMRFTYWDLPKQNTDFGAKRLTARTKNVCACERGDTIRAFFVATDNDHPDDRSPNWFYYWKQTPAAGGARSRLEYRASVEDASLPGVSAADYDPVTTKIYVSDELIGAKGCHARYSRETGLMLLDPSTNQARGIDCFGETARHEMQHRTDALAWWGTEHGKEALNTAEYVLLDPDGDMVPSRIESQMTGCSSFNKFSCPQRPFPNVIDAEINAYWVGWEWVLKSADAHDWSCGPLAKQWKGKKCGH
jgi:hypothetical protein